jgi:hypothetical protein
MILGVAEAYIPSEGFGHGKLDLDLGEERGVSEVGINIETENKE